MRKTLITCIAVASLLAACGSSKSTNGATATTGTRPATTPPPTTTAPAGPTTTAAPNFAAAKIRLTEVVSGLTRPVALVPRHGTTTLYVADQTGQIRTIVNGKLTATPVLDIKNQVSTGNEQGLLGITFSPDGKLLYIDITDTNGDTRVIEYTMNGDIATVSSRRQLLFVKQPYPNHNGGEVLTGPDGMLYIGLGDGGSENDPNHIGQNPATLLSKILRINPKASATGPYSVPANNPFVSTAGARPETWEWGLRNPWRFSFDRLTGDLWIGDVGQGTYEEIDFAKAGTGGLNYGWSRREGDHPFNGGARPPHEVDPVYEYTHASGGVAVTGGYVYRGTRIPDLYGAYIFTDYAEGNITALKQKNGVISGSRVLTTITGEVSSFGEDNAGELYVLDLIDGKVFRIDPA